MPVATSGVAINFLFSLTSRHSLSQAWLGLFFLPTLGQYMNKIEDFELYQSEIRNLLRRFSLIDNTNFWIVFGTIGETTYGLHNSYSSYVSSSISFNSITNDGWRDFYYSLNPILETMIEHRSNYVVSGHYHCVVSVEFSAINVEWVDEDVADMVVAVLRDAYNSDS
jgi:hypothetical protein